MNQEIEARFMEIEKRLSRLETPDKDDEVVEDIEIDLELPEADIDGLHFNETKVHAVFEKQDDGWYHSRDILFLSARNAKGDNSVDILTKYLNATPLKKAESRIREQIAEALGISSLSIEIFLPKENDGVKKYNGVDWWYWLADPYSAVASSFCAVTNNGNSNDSSASSVGGCAPAFCVQ